MLKKEARKEGICDVYPVKNDPSSDSISKYVKNF